ncbi:MAG: ATP-binding protein [Pseudomonadota bacterium]|nr:ATP-binding protein [Pseudomonadota bacterium]
MRPWWPPSGWLRPGVARAASQAAADRATVRADSQHAVHEERARIYRDLHDDIGARLVSILSASTDERIRELARDALHDLREVVYHARGEPGSLEQVLGEIRSELADRLKLAGWRLEWLPEALPDVLLPGDCTIHVYRILREATTNAIKHAAPGTLRVRMRVHGGMVYVDITDQGGQEPDGSLTSSGAGQQGMRDRAERIGGQLAIEPGTLCGTKVMLRFPLPGGGKPA